MNIDVSTPEKLHEYLMSLVEREKRTGVPSSAEELAPAIEEMFRQQAEFQRRLDKLSEREKISFNNNVPLLLSDKYKTLATEDQVAIFGALCLHLVMAVDSARNGDFKEANLHMITGGMEQEDRERALYKFRNGSCPVLVSTDLAARGLDIPGIDNVVHPVYLHSHHTPFIQQEENQNDSP